MDRGVIISGVGHVAVVLWAILGGWLFNAQSLPEIQVTDVTFISVADFNAALSSAPPVAEDAPTPVAQPVQPADQVTPPETQVDPAPAADPTPAPEPAPVADAAPAADPSPAPPPDPVPEPLPESPTPQPDDAPPPLAPPADLPQPTPQPTLANRPKQRPVTRVAEVPVDDPPEAPRTDEVATPAVSDTPAPDAQPEPPKPEAQPQETVTEVTPAATDDTTQRAPTASQRPKTKPVKVAANPEAPAADTGAADAAQADAEAKAAADKQAAADAKAAADKKAEQDAINAAIAAASATAPAGPPMSSGEIDALRVSIKKCWSTGTLSTEASQTVITVRVNLSETGVPDLRSMRMTSFDGGPEAAAKIVFGAAKSAVIRCGRDGFPLPSDKYQAWKDLELVFDPRQMQ